MYFRYTRTYKILLGVPIAVIIYMGAAWYFSNIIISFEINSMEKELELRKIKSPEQAGLKNPEQHIIPVTDHNGKTLKISAWYFPSRSNRCAVILQHGHTSRNFGMLKYAPIFRRYDCHLLMPDARYHGHSEGKFCTYGYHERKDLAQIIDWLRVKTGLPASQIGLMGSSMGGAIVLMTAAEYPEELAFVMADSPYKDLYSILTQEATHRYGNWMTILFFGAEHIANIRASFRIADVSPEKEAAKIKIPVFLTHSVDDALIPAGHSEAIYRAIRHDKKEIYITRMGARHVLSIDMNPGEYMEKVDDFMLRYRIFR